MVSFVISATLFFIELVLFHSILSWIHSLLFFFHKLLLLFDRHFHSFISSVQFSCTVKYDSLRPHGLQHARLPCPLPAPGAWLKLMSIELGMPSNHLILCRPLLLPSISPSIRVFSIESVLHIRWPKDWSFSFSISTSNEYSGLISFKIDWFHLLAVQGAFKSLFQHHNSKT